MQHPKGRGRAHRGHFAGRLLVLGALALSACALTPDRLPAPYKQFYYNLPNDADKQAFLKLEESQREPFLKQRGLWERWTALPADERQAAMNGEVKVGHHEFAAFMAWGPPADTQGAQHTFIQCSSGPKRGRYVHDNLECDGTSTEIKLIVRDDVIVELQYFN
ncbi:MAG: hypothetical protein R3A51_12395 [Nannocystaceae bacterium]